MSVPSVAVLLVSHDGSRWLPGVLEGLAEQADLVSRVVAVDTGSRDESVELLAEALSEHFPGRGVVLTAPPGTSYPQAVEVGVDHIAGLTELDTEAPDWIWLLHDDSRPAPGALAALLEVASVRTGAAVLGPKLREWPSLLRLLELGVTISGTGRRETGLERGEYDQGQHDEVREVLAVNTAGMLVRRAVLEELGGFDHQLPIFGNDIDFGWRAAARGHTTLVVPQAVVFHAEAAHRGVRQTPMTGRHTHYQERRAAIYTLLVNGPGRTLPLRVGRLVLGTLLRMLGFLVVRSPGEALDDLAALVSVLSRPSVLRSARADRAGGEPDRAKPLLPPWWVPYRHGLDFVADLVAAVTNQAADVAERRRIAAAERDPSSQAATRVRTDEDDELTDTGIVARFLTNPVAIVLSLVVLVSLAGAHTAIGSVTGGALAPVPSDAGDWWGLHLHSWHRLGLGTDVPAPPYVVVLALMATVVGTTWAVSVLMLLAVPFALWGSWRFLRIAGRLVSPRGAPRWLLVGGATAYAIVPVTSGGWAEGRLGLVVASALVPWVAHAAVGFADPDAERRQRAGWRVGLLLSLAAAFAPLAWFVVLALTVVVLLAGRRLAGDVVTRRDVWLPPLTGLAVPLVLLAPWWLPSLWRGSARALLLDTGRLPSATVEPIDVLTGRVGDLGAPGWMGVIVLVLAVLALVPRATRIPVGLCWLVALVAVLVAVVAGLFSFRVSGIETPAGVGIAVLVVQAALVAAVVLGAQGASRADLGRLRPAVLTVAAAAAVVPLAGLGWFVLADNMLSSTTLKVVPAYMVQSSVQAPQNGILVVRGSVSDGLTYTVRRDDGVTLGEDEVIALAAERDGVTATMRSLLARPTGAVIERLGELGIAWIILPAPADGAVSATLDATSGLAQSSSDPGTRAWQVTRPVAADAVDGSGSVIRVILLLVQGLALAVVLVQAAPTLRPGGRRR